MSDTVKLIIEIPRNEYKYTCERTLSDRTFWDDAIRKGVPLDDVKAEIKIFTITEKSEYDTGFNDAVLKCFNVLDNIGKAESEENKSCDNCKWNKTEKCQPSTCAMIGCDGHGLWDKAESEDEE